MFYQTDLRADFAVLSEMSSRQLSRNELTAILQAGRNEALLARRASEDRRENPRLRVGLTRLKTGRSEYSSRLRSILFRFTAELWYVVAFNRQKITPLPSPYPANPSEACDQVYGL